MVKGRINQSQSTGGRPGWKHGPTAILKTSLTFVGAYSSEEPLRAAPRPRDRARNSVENKDLSTLEAPMHAARTFAANRGAGEACAGVCRCGTRRSTSSISRARPTATKRSRPNCSALFDRQAASFAAEIGRPGAPRTARADIAHRLQGLGARDRRRPRCRAAEALEIACLYFGLLARIRRRARRAGPRRRRGARGDRGLARLSLHVRQVRARLSVA